MLENNFIDEFIAYLSANEHGAFKTIKAKDRPKEAFAVARCLCGDKILYKHNSSFFQTFHGRCTDECNRADVPWWTMFDGVSPIRPLKTC